MWKILLSIFVVMLIIAVGYEFYVSPPKSSCISIGKQIIPNNTQGKECCANLIPIVSAPANSYTQQAGKAIPPANSQFVCAPCGNARCDSSEHAYNCPVDCS